MKSKRRILLFISLIVAGILLFNTVGFFCVSAIVYESVFDYRYTTNADDFFEVSDFPALTRERHTFTSNKGQMLVGYLYEDDRYTLPKKGVVVFAHGLGGGGQTGYMDVFYYLTSKGYYVFAYDATANDESEGNAVGGLPQGYIDLDYAIDYAYTIEEIKGMPIVLMGYSWGGMSVLNVLNYHPEVAAVASLSGWNDPFDLIEYEGIKMMGEPAKTFLPFVWLYESFKYGHYSQSSAMKGLANSTCPVMIVHGADDEIVPIEYGYDAYYESYGENSRFTFKKYEDRGHEIFGDNGSLDIALIIEITNFFDESLAIG